MATPQEVIEYLKEQEPLKYKNLSDRLIYKSAKRRFPDANIDDWPEMGFVTTPKVVDPLDSYDNKTDEDSFMDHANLWGIDEDSWYINRLAYNRSLQGFATTLVNGKPKFDNLRQPAIWEEAIAGLLAFAQPLDFASLAVGGGLLGKAVLSRTATQSFTKNAAKKLVTKFPSMKGQQAAVQTSINTIIGSEMMYVPYEAAKANLWAKTAHLTDPDNYPEPLSSSQIMRETWAGVGHGALMGVIGGSARPFMAGKYAKALQKSKQLDLQKSVLSKTQKATMTSLKKQMKYTGEGAQAATEVVGLTGGDFVATGVFQGHIKSWDEIMVSLATMTGFAGATRAAGYGMNKVAFEPLERMKREYALKFEEKAKLRDSGKKVKKNLDEDSKNNTDAENKAAENANSALDEEINRNQETTNKFKDSEIYKKIEGLKRRLLEFDKLIEDDVLTPEGAKKQFKERKELYDEIKEEFSKSEYSGLDIDEAKLDKWFEEGDKIINESILIKKEDQDKTFVVNLAKLKFAGAKSVIILKEGKTTTVKLNKILENFDGDTKEANKFIQDQIDVLERKNKDAGLDKKIKEVINLKDKKSKLEEKKAKIVSDNNFNTDDALQKQAQKYDDGIKFSKQIDKEIKGAGKNKSLINNLRLLKAWATTELIDMVATTGAAGKALPPLQTKKRIDHFNEALNFIIEASKDNPDVLVGNFKASTIQDMIQGKKFKSGGTGVQSFLNFLKNQEVLSAELKKYAPKGSLTAAVKGKATSADSGLPVGVQSKDFLFDNEGKVMISTLVSKAAAAVKTLSTTVKNSFAKIGRTHAKVMKQVVKLSKKYKVYGKNTKSGKITGYELPFFILIDHTKIGKSKFLDSIKAANTSLKDGVLTAIAIGNETVNNLSKIIFNKNAKSYRKGLTSYVAKKYGIDSKQAVIADLFVLGHDKLSTQTTQSKAYQDLKIDTKTGLPKSGKWKEMLAGLQDEFQGFIFDGKTASDLKMMDDAKLKAYGLTKKSLENASPDEINIYELKKGFENLESLKKIKNKDGFIEITNDKGNVLFSIHEDVLEGLFRNFTETSARINEQVATLNNIPGVPVLGGKKDISSMETLINRFQNEVPISKSGTPIINIIPAKTTKQTTRGTSSLSSNSSDTVKSLKIKIDLSLRNLSLDADGWFNNNGALKYLRTKLKKGQVYKGLYGDLLKYLEAREANIKGNQRPPLEGPNKKRLEKIRMETIGKYISEVTDYKKQDNFLSEELIKINKKGGNLFDVEIDYDGRKMNKAHLAKLADLLNCGG